MAGKPTKLPSTVLGTVLLYESFFVISQNSSDFAFSKIEFVISHNRFCDFEKSNRLSYITKPDSVYSWVVIINAKSYLLYQKSNLCHHQSIMISKYPNDFVLSQIVFCGIENRCRDITELNWRKFWKNWGYYNFSCYITKSILRYHKVNFLIKIVNFWYHRILSSSLWYYK